MNCEIISSSGKEGNAVLLNGFLLFDCGIPWKKLKPYANRIRLVFLTHIHGDHFNIKTIRKLNQTRPLLRFVCAANLITPLVTQARVPLDKILLVRPEDEPGKTHDFLTGTDITMSSFHLLHDVPNVGWIVNVSGGEEPGTAMYATDTHHIPIAAPGLDLYMIEANYTQEGMERRVAAKTEKGVFSYEERVKASHMSLETAMEWLRENADPYRSKIVFLHQHKEAKTEGGSEVDSLDTDLQQSDTPSEDHQPCG